jgi:hypothetical protein
LLDLNSPTRSNEQTIPLIAVPVGATDATELAGVARWSRSLPHSSFTRKLAVRPPATGRRRFARDDEFATADCDHPSQLSLQIADAGLARAGRRLRSGSQRSRRTTEAFFLVPDT